MKSNALKISCITLVLACASTSFAGSWSSSGGIIGDNNAQSIAMESLKSSQGVILPIPDKFKPPIGAEAKAGDAKVKADLVSSANQDVIIIEAYKLKSTPKFEKPKESLFFRLGTKSGKDEPHNNCPPKCETIKKTFPCPSDNTQTCESTETICKTVTHC